MTELITIIEQNPSLISSVIAILALGVSFLAILLTFISLVLQRTHNLKSVTPIAVFELADYEDQISVRILNAGIGPLLVTRFSARTLEGQTAVNLISLMPNLSKKFCWDTYSEHPEDYQIISAHSVTLLKFSGNIDDEDFCNQRDAIRKHLSEIELTLEYKDIYGRKMPISIKSLKWFARHL